MESSIKEIWNYCTEHSSPCSELLMELDRETHLKTLAPQMMSGTLQGRIMSMISKLVNPTHILEIGTFTGYGTLCLAEGLVKDGKITTIEINQELTDISTRYFDRSSFSKQINALQGDALKLLPELADTYDLVYIDAGKKDNARYLELVIDKVNAGGVILTDNVLWAGKVLDTNPTDGKTQSIQSYNQKALKDPRLEVVILPIRDGMSVFRKK